MGIGLQTRRHKIFFTGSLLLVLLLLFIPVDVTHAAEETNSIWSYFLGKADIAAGWTIGLALSPIVAAMTSLMAMITSYVGTLFDMAISYTIVDYSTHFSEGASSIQSGVNTVWTAFRDLANIALIGVFVYIAFMIMLGAQSFSAEKFAVRVLVIALLINFSLFFTKVVIDVSNITAIQFHKTLSAKANNQSIATTFMGRIGIPATWANQSFLSEAGSASTKGLTKLLAYAIFTSLFLAAVTAVFLYAVILLFSRALAFIFLMVTSPLAFAAFMIPQMEKHWKTWWSLLLRNALFAPLLMMMLWATLTITGSLQGNGKSLADTIGGDLGKVGGLFDIIIILGLLYASVKISSSLSLTGTNLAESIAKKGFGTAAKWSGAGVVGRMGLSAYARASRGVTGVAALSVEQRKRQEYLREHGNFLQKRMANTRLYGDKNIAGLKTDLRGMDFMKSAQKATGVNLGKPTESYNEYVKRRGKERGQTMEAHRDAEQIRLLQTQAAAIPATAAPATQPVTSPIAGAHDAAEETRGGNREQGEQPDNQAVRGAAAAPLTQTPTAQQRGDETTTTAESEQAANVGRQDANIENVQDRANTEAQERQVQDAGGTTGREALEEMTRMRTAVERMAGTQEERRSSVKELKRLDEKHGISRDGSNAAIAHAEHENPESGRWNVFKKGKRNLFTGRKNRLIDQEAAKYASRSDTDKLLEGMKRIAGEDRVNKMETSIENIANRNQN